MVTVFNPQGLSDPGPAAGANALSGVIGSLLGLEKQKMANKNALLTSLLGGGVDIGQSLLAAKSAKDVQTLKGEQDLAEQQRLLQLQAGTNLDILGLLGGGQTGGVTPTAPSGGLTVTEQPQPDTKIPAPSQTLFPGLAPDKQFTPDTGLKSQDLTFNQPTKQPLKGGLSAVDEIPLSEASPTDPRLEKLRRIAPFVKPSEFIAAARASGLGVQGSKDLMELEKIRREESEAAITRDPRLDKPFEEQRLRQLDIDEKADKLKFLDPAFKFGINETTGEAAKGVPSAASSQNIMAIDINKQPLGVKSGPRMVADHRRYGDMGSKAREEVAETIGQSPLMINQFVGLTKNLLKTRGKGVIERTRMKLILDGTLDIADAQTPAEVAALTFVDQTSPIVLQNARAAQGSGVVTDKDFETLKPSLGDPGSGGERLLNDLSMYIARSYLGSLKNASSADAVSFKELKAGLESLTGTEFNYETDINDLTKVAALVKKGLSDSTAVDLEGIDFNSSSPIGGGNDLQQQLNALSDEQFDLVEQRANQLIQKGMDRNQALQNALKLIK